MQNSSKDIRVLRNLFFLLFCCFGSTCLYTQDAFLDRVPVNAFGLTLSGGFLKWYAEREAPSKTSSWDSGFRVGLGFESQNIWDLEALYSQFRTTGRWRLKYNTLDLACHWLRYPTPYFAFQPYLGLRGAFIKQRLSPYREEHLRAGGLLFGTDFEVRLWRSIALFSSFWGSALLGNKDVESLSAQGGLKGIFPLYLRESVLSFTLAYEYTRWIHLHALTLQGISLLLRADF